MLCGLDEAPFSGIVTEMVAGGSLSQNSLLAISLLYAEIMAARTCMDNHEVCCALDRFKLLITLITTQTSVLVSENNGFQLVSRGESFLSRSQLPPATGLYGTLARLADR